MATVRSPVLVGRRVELSSIEAGLDEVRHGRGGLVLLVGEAGIGKSRLLAETVARARRRGLATLLGRAVEGGGTYRAVAEALTALPDDRLAEREDLRPYRAALGRLVPGWARPGDTPASTVDPTIVLGQGLLRLLRALNQNGCLLVLEDLHLADADTVALVEYLATAAPGWPVLIAASVRDDEPLSGLLGRLLRTDGVTVLRLPRLDTAEIATLAEHCSADAPLPEEVRGFLVDRSEGLPFLVEELLAGVRAANPSWSVADPAVPVPPTLAGLVGERLARLAPEHRRVVEAAAVLGRDLDPMVLAATVGQAEGAVIAALHAAVDAHLLVEAGNELRWRHALSRDAVLATVFGPLRSALARGAATACRRRGRPDDEVYAAELLATAGEARSAADMFLEVARRQLAAGALRTADDLLTRAAATGALRPAVVIERVQLLTLRGRPAEALEVGADVIEEVRGDDHAELCLRLAQAALSASRWPVAERYIERAGRPDDPRSLVLAADAAFGAGDIDRATALAGMAADRAAALAAVPDADATRRRKRMEAWCAALTVLGRCALRRDPGVARNAFARAAQIAAEHGLRALRVTALMGIGTIELFDHLTSPALRETRELALDTGMLAVVISIDLAEVERIFRVAGPRAAEPAARHNAEQAERLRLYRSQAMADLYVAAGRAAAGDAAGMERLIEAAMARPHASAEVVGGSSAIRALPCMFAHDLKRATEHLDACVAALGPDGASYPGLVWGMWVLVRTVLDDRGAQARDRLRASIAARPAVNRGALLYADAVAAGRAGRHGDAEALFASADQTLSGQHWWRRLLRLFALEAAVVDGWGEPVAALRADLEAFERGGDESLARTCRDLLRRAGAPTRRGRGRTPVPAPLRAAGVTTREMDVLALLADGLTNREIADRLFLSPRTVETHVASLLAKTGTASRAELRAIKAQPLTP